MWGEENQLVSLFFFNPKEVRFHPLREIIYQCFLPSIIQSITMVEDSIL